MNTFWEFLQSYWLYILIGIYLLIALSNKPKREETFSEIVNTLKDLAIKPTVKTGPVLIYEKGELSKISSKVNEVMVKPVEDLVNKWNRWINEKREAINKNNDNPLKKFWYLFALIFCILFIFADAIAVISAIHISPLAANPTGTLKVVQDFLLANYEIAVLFGSLMTLIVVGIVGIDMTGGGNITDSGKKTGIIRYAMAALLFLLTLSAISAVIGLGLYRLDAMYPLRADWHNFAQWFFNVDANLLIPINTVISTLLISQEAILGLMVLVLAVIQALIGVLGVVYYFLRILGALGVLGLDIIIFPFYFCILIVELIIAPPLSLFSLMWKERPHFAGSNYKTEAEAKKV